MVYIELSKEFRNEDVVAEAVAHLRDSGIFAQKENDLIMVSHDDGVQATEVLAERGFLMHAVTYSQDDDADNAIFDAVQSLCPFPVVRNHKMIAYMVSVIANAMKGLGLSVCEDVLDRNETVCEATEFSLKHINPDAETAAKVTMLPRPDDDLLCEAGDQIDNAVFNAIQVLSDKKLDWDMHYIGNVTMAIESAMESFGVPSCHPWQDDDENICYSLDNERCAHCQRCKQEE